MADPTPDAYDEFGNPMFKSDLLTICPAEHIIRGREIALYFFRDVMLAKGAALEFMFTQKAASVGSNTPSHYVCYRRVYPSELEKQLETQANLNDEFVATGIVDIISPESLTTFCCVACDLDLFLSTHNMELV